MAGAQALDFFDGAFDDAPGVKVPGPEHVALQLHPAIVVMRRQIHEGSEPRQGGRAAEQAQRQGHRQGKECRESQAQHRHDTRRDVLADDAPRGEEAPNRFGGRREVFGKYPEVSTNGGVDAAFKADVARIILENAELLRRLAK